VEEQGHEIYVIMDGKKYIDPITIYLTIDNHNNTLKIPAPTSFLDQKEKIIEYLSTNTPNLNNCLTITPIENTG
jgi:hypothetical protein